jgi:hypothetical protein
LGGYNWEDHCSKKAQGKKSTKPHLSGKNMGVIPTTMGSIKKDNKETL